MLHEQIERYKNIHMIMSVNAENSFNKIHLFMIKIPLKQLKRNYLNKIKARCGKSQELIFIFNGEGL